MPAPRPTQGLHNLGRHASLKGRTYRSVCKLCPAGVYSDQPSVWLRDPMGLSHQDCADREVS